MFKNLFIEQIEMDTTQVQ